MGAVGWGLRFGWCLLTGQLLTCINYGQRISNSRLRRSSRASTLNPRLATEPAAAHQCVYVIRHWGLTALYFAFKLGAVVSMLTAESPHGALHLHTATVCLFKNKAARVWPGIVKFPGSASEEFLAYSCAQNTVPHECSMIHLLVTTI